PSFCARSLEAALGLEFGTLRGGLGTAPSVAWVLEPREGRAPAAAGGWSVAKLGYVRAALKRRLNPDPLHALAPAVDQTNLAETFVEGGLQVVLHHVWDVARLKGVQ